MQAAMTPYHLDFKFFSLNFKPIRKLKDDHLGEVTLYKDKRNQSIVQVKEQPVTSEKDLMDVIWSLNELLPLNNSGIFLKFLGFSIKKTQELMSKTPTLWTLYMIYEYWAGDLEKEVANRVKSGEFYSEKRLWVLCEEIVKGMALLGGMKRKFGEVRLARIWTTEQGFKIWYTNYNCSAIERIRKGELDYYKYFISRLGRGREG